jgi:hypothetical protein
MAIAGLFVLVFLCIALVNHKINRLARRDVYYHDGTTPCWKEHRSYRGAS